MTRTFKIQITETTLGCRPSHPLTIEAPADDVSALIHFIACLPMFSKPGVDVVPIPRGAKITGDVVKQTHIKRLTGHRGEWINGNPPDWFLKETLDKDPNCVGFIEALYDSYITGELWRPKLQYDNRPDRP